MGELDRVRLAQKRAALRAIELSAGDLLAKAMPRVPKDESTLRGSGQTAIIVDRVRYRSGADVPDDLLLRATTIYGEVSFSTPYAIPMHEGMWETGPLAGVRIRHYREPGTGAKYLENPLKENATRYGRVTETAIARAV